MHAKTTDKKSSAAFRLVSGSVGTAVLFNKIFLIGTKCPSLMKISSKTKVPKSLSKTKSIMLVFMTMHIPSLK